jgi:hypothetical protein
MLKTAQILHFSCSFLTIYSTLSSILLPDQRGNITSVLLAGTRKERDKN